MCYVITWTNVVWYHIDGLVQERRNSSALAMELRLSCINPLICHHLAILRSIFALCIAKWRTWPRGPKSLEFSGNELLRSPNRASWFLLPSWAPLCYGRCLVKPLTLLLVTLVWKTSDFVVIYIKNKKSLSSCTIVTPLCMWWWVAWDWDRYGNPAWSPSCLQANLEDPLPGAPGLWFLTLHTNLELHGMP